MPAREVGSDKMSAWCQLGREGPKKDKKKCQLICEWPQKVYWQDEVGLGCQSSWKNIYIIPHLNKKIMKKSS